MFLQVHPDHGRAALGISEHLLSKHGDSESPLAFYQLTCPKGLLRTFALRIHAVKAAALGVERLWSYARSTLTPQRRSMHTHRLMQLMHVKMNGPHAR